LPKDIVEIFIKTCRRSILSVNLVQGHTRYCLLNIFSLPNNFFGSMQLKPTAFKLAVLWATASAMTACSSPNVSCDDPSTPGQEVCGTVATNPPTNPGGTTNTTTRTSGGVFIYRTGGFYRSAGSTYVGGNGGSSVGAKGFSGRSGFGSTGGGRSGFG
jgi:hypothetical protein